MGRHAAPDDAPVHPLVAEGLAHRPAETAAAHRPAVASEGVGEPGPVGWPEPESEPAGAPVGWPGSTPDEGAPEEPPTEAEPPAEAAAPAGGGRHTVGAPPRRRGWRRFFGGDRAA